MLPLLRVLVLIDTVADCDMLAHELRRAGFELALLRATTEAAYLAALEAPLDLIVADHALPAFDALRALEILRSSALDIPLLVVTDTASEAAAIECVNLGAADFLFKDRPARLGSAAVRALEQRELRVHARAADTALHTSAVINQAVLDSLTAHIALLNAAGVIVAVNQAWQRFAHENGDQELAHTGVGVNYLEVCDPAAGVNSAEARLVAQAIAAVLARELDQFTIEYPCHSPHEERWFILRVTPLAGEHTGAVVAHENITARRRFELALRESEERFRTTFEQAAVGIAHLALAGQFLRVNERLCAILGYSQAALLNCTIHDLNIPELVAFAQEGAHQLLEHQIPSYSTELSFLHKNSSQVWINVTVSLVRDDTGAPLYFIALVEDITTRRKSDVTRALLASVVDSSDDAIISIAPDGTVMSWNTGAEHVYGYRADDMIGQPIAILQPPALHESSAQLYDRLTRGAITTHIETVRRCNDGRLIDVAVTISVIYDADGGVSGFSTISRDISARKHDERALIQKSAFIQLFQEVAAAANQASSLDQALQTAVDTICTHIGWPVGHVYLPDPDLSGALLPTTIWHLEDAQRFATFRAITEVVRLAPGIGLPGQAMASRKPAWIADMILDVSTPRTRLIQDIGVRAGFVLPVLLGDQVAAVLEFFATEAIVPDEALLEVLHHVGTQLGRVVERTRAEDALRESEARFRVLFEHSPDAVLLIDPHASAVMWPIIECNDVACRMNGYTRTELIGQSIDLLNTKTDTPAGRAAYIEQLRRAGTMQFEVMHRRKDGSFFPIEAMSSLIVVAGRELVLGIDRDISERKRAEHALQAAEAQYRALVEQIPAIIYTAALDAHSSTSYVSPQIKTILGFSPEEWLACPELWIQQVHPDDWAAKLDSVARAQTSDTPVRLEYRAFTRDGRLVWLNDTARVVRGVAGQALFLQGITLDISERKQAEAVLARYQMLSEHARDIILFLAGDGRIIEANQAALLAYGYTRDEILALSIYDIRPAEMRREVDLRLAQVDSTGILYEAVHCRKDARRFPVEVGSRSTIIEDVRVIVSIIRDITERKQAEAALAQREAYFRALIEHSADAIMLFGMDGIIHYGSPATSRILGYALRNFVGHSAFEFIAPEDQAQITQKILQIVDKPEATVTVNARVQHADGSWRDLEGRFTNLLADPAVGAIVNNYHDITERKRIEAALDDERALLAQRVDDRTADLSAANAELARAARLKDEFLASMSHELRTPLNAVLGLSESLQEEIYGAINDRQRRALHSVEESGRHLLELINDILDLAKIGAGKLDLDLAPVPIEMICQASLRLIAQIGQKKRLSVDLTIDPAVTLLHVDARRVKQILVNLLSNAVKFTPEGGAIGLEVVGNVTRQAVELTIWDTGIGIAHEHMGHLFQPFVQLDSRLARQYEGTGLGLALVYRMVEIHGGSVAVTSEVGVGSRFTISLPWQPAPDSDQRSSAAAGLLNRDHTPMRHAGAPPTALTRAIPQPVVLLAEDNEATITIIVDYLATRGYQVVVVRNGAETLARVRAARPAIVLMDIQMPGMDGIEATRRIRSIADLADLPIIALTALAMPGDRERCLAAGANAYLSKPVSLHGLASLIETTLQTQLRP